MALNIKNERVCALAKEASVKSGRSQVSVLEQALLDFLAHLATDEDQSEAIARRMAASARVVAETRAMLSDEDRAAIRRAADEMYDDQGLPLL